MEEQKLSSNLKQKSNVALAFNANKALVILINKKFWQGVSGPIFAYAFSAVFVGIFGYIMLASGNIVTFKQSLAGVIALQVMSVGINSTPQALNEFKTSVLLKRIGATPIKPWMFIVTTALYYAFIMFTVALWMLLWIVIWFGAYKVSETNGMGWQGALGTVPTTAPTQIYHNLFQVIFNSHNDVYALPMPNHQPSINVNNPTISWGGFFLSIIYTDVVAIFIGVAVVSLTKSAGRVQAISMPIFFLSMFLSGQLFPMSTICQNEVLNGISYITPFRYTTGLIQMSWSGSNIFDMTQPFIQHVSSGATVTVYKLADLWLNFFMPFLFVGLSIFTSIKFFKWNAR